MAVYRTRDGARYFEFSFEQQDDGTIRPYIVRQPDYSGRDATAHATHRLHDGRRFYICWTHSLWSIDDARAVAREWAERTHAYIATGRRF